MFQANYLVIPVPGAIATFWKTKYPDLEDLFELDNFYLSIAPESYTAVWGVASEVKQGYSTKYAILSEHKLEGFDVNLADECNCASVYYLLKDLEETSKEEECGSYKGIIVHDHVLPDLQDIKQGQEYTVRQCLLEVETSSGSMGVDRDRAFFGGRLIFQILAYKKGSRV